MPIVGVHKAACMVVQQHANARDTYLCEENCKSPFPSVQVLFTDGVYIMAENLTQTTENTTVLLRDAAQILFAQIGV